MTNIFDVAKQEIRELIDLAKYIEKFDYKIMYASGVKPTEIAFERRKRNERRYITLLKKYT